MSESFASFLSREYPQIGSYICREYCDPDVTGTCNPGCPFNAECQPFFDSLGRELEKIPGIKVEE